MMKVYLSVRRSADGQFYIRMRHANGNKAMASETYKRRATAARILARLLNRQMVLDKK